MEAAEEASAAGLPSAAAGSASLLSVAEEIATLREVVADLQHQLFALDVPQLAKDLNWALTKLTNGNGEDDVSESFSGLGSLALRPIVGSDPCVRCGSVLASDYCIASEEDFVVVSREAVVPSCSSGWICGSCGGCSSVVLDVAQEVVVPWCRHCQLNGCVGKTLFCSSRRPST